MTPNTMTTTARTTMGTARRTTTALATLPAAIATTFAGRPALPVDRATGLALLACLLAVAATVAPAAAAGSPAGAGVDTAGTAGAATAGGPATAAGTAGPAALRDEHNASVRVTNVTTDPAEPAVGQETTFAVTVVNDGEDPLALTKIEILDRERAEFQPKQPHATGEDFGRLAPGERRTIRIRGNLTETGLLRLRANVTAETRIDDASFNTTVRDSRVFSVDVVEIARPGVTIAGQDLRAKVTSTVRVTITNNAEEPINDVEVRLSGEFEVENPTRTVSTIPAGSEETVAFNVTADATGDRTASVSAKYDVVGLDRRIRPTRTTLTFEEPRTADIVLTSAETEVSEGRIHVSGRIANRGDIAASGVTLSIADADGVAGAQPNPRYFIDGGVEVDKSAGFDLYARVEEGVTEIPIRISYKSNGLTKTQTVVVTYRRSGDSGSGGPAGDSDGGGGGGMAWLLGVLVVLGVVGTMGYAWRNASDDDPEDGPPVSPESGGSVLDSGDPGDGGTPGAGEAHGSGLSPGGGEPGSGDAHGSGGRDPDPGRPVGGTSGPGRGGPAEGPGGGDPGRAGPADDRANATGPRGRESGTPQGGHEAPQGGPTHASNGHHGHGSPDAGGTGADPHRSGATGAGAAGAGPAGEEVLCDGCGRTYAPDQVGRVAISEGQSATTCQECQERALTAAKTRLGAEESDESDEVDDLVSAMKDGVTCDGCGDAVLEEDLEEMTLPDGSSAVACSSCRERALEAARRELTGGAGEGGGT